MLVESSLRHSAYALFTIDPMVSARTIDRKQWLGYRWERHGLAVAATKSTIDDLLVLGIRTGRNFGEQQALVARTDKIGSTKVADVIGPDGPLSAVWSARGAPHVHRATHLHFVCDAFAPQPSDEGGEQYVETVAVVADAITSVLSSTMSKSDVSSLVSERVPAELLVWCERCTSRHVPDGTFRAAGRRVQALIDADPSSGAAVMMPPPAVKQIAVDDAPRAMLGTYLRVNGPTSRAQYRDWAGAGTAAVASLWKQCSDNLIRVQVDGKASDAPESVVDALATAAPAEGAVLVPPNDPYLRQVDRTLLVADKERRQQIWRALSPPGAVLIDGDVAGTWRYRRAEHGITVSAFDTVTAAARADIEASAEKIAAIVDDDLDVRWQ